MRRPLRLPPLMVIVRFVLLTAAMVFFNFAMPRREPAAFLLLWSAVLCRGMLFSAPLAYLAASAVALSWQATLCALAQAATLLLACGLCVRFGVKMGAWRIALCLVAQLPFLLLFPHTGYAFPLPVLAQKAIISLFFALAALLAERGSEALDHATRCRLTGADLAALAFLWLLGGMGVCAALGELVYTGIALAILLFAVATLGTAAVFPLAVALALPLAAAGVTVLPVALFALYACSALLLAPYGRIASSLALTLLYLAVGFFEGVYALPAVTILLHLLACLLPAALVCALPRRLFEGARESLLFYRERALPRIAVNRNRRAIGERLYEISALFREIGNAFLLPDGEENGERRIADALLRTVCENCPGRRGCEEVRRESLCRLVRVGRAKGKANLIDLPADLAKVCPNVAGLLFSLNRELEQDARRTAALETAREGRRLLAGQAHGVSEIMRDLALRESEEYALSDREEALSRALQEGGILSSEIFLYGEGASLTVSMTLDEDAPAERACRAASEVLGTPLTLAEKLPLTHRRACFVFRRRPRYDAAFGIAARPKEGEQSSGDTHSILKIDERRFLVALSDGMGSGEAARDVSARTLSLLESFYKTGMPSDIILATVNRLIAFSADERFSCLDLAAVDLDDGSADIVKIGSPVGFLLTGEELHMLEGESLPIGALDAVHPATMRLTMHEDDFLLFMSDGVTGAFGSPTDLAAYLGELRPLNPQALAENVLSAALARSQRGEAGDDMTVLAVKLTAAA